MLNAVCALSPTQLAIIIVVAAVAVLIVVGNVVLSYLRHKNTERTLCTHQLQQKRNELLAHLEEVKRWNKTSPAEEEGGSESENGESPEVKIDEEDEIVEETAVDSALAPEFVVPPIPEGANYDALYEVLAVKDMTPAMCEKCGLNQTENLNKRYYVKYVYGFDAQLRNADPSVQQHYVSFVNEIGQYKGVRIKTGFYQQRIYKGQTTLALILFKDNTLSVAFALDPAHYAETKYRGIDKSGTKRFADTPMLLKVTSESKLGYAKYLFVQVADANTILLSDDPIERKYDFSPKSKADLFLADSLRIQFMGEAPADAESRQKTE